MSKKPNHPYADLLGFVVQRPSSGESVCTLGVVETLFNPQNVVHGGALYSMADTGMGAALYSTMEKGEFCATIEIKITYLRAVREGKLICKSKLVHRGKRIAFLESEIFNGDALVVKATGSFSIFQPKRE